MSNLILLDGARRKDLTAPPVALWKLRWRIVTQGGVTVQSSWTPEYRYPSIRETLLEFANRIDAVHVDGINNETGQRMTFLSCPGDAFLELSYKMMSSLASGATIIAGIQVTDREQTSYLVLRDGTVFTEGKQANVSNDN